MLDEGEDTVVLHVPWLTESLLQLLLHVLLAVQKINLGVLQQEISSALHPRKLMLELMHLLKPRVSEEGEFTFAGNPPSPLSTARSRTNLL